MIPQHIKDALFAVNHIAVRPNQWLWRARLHRASRLHVHLGCGPDRIKGMLNCDGNLLAKPDVWLDLRLALPFATGSTLVVYCSHTLEHLFPAQAIKLLQEIRRILRPDGIARVAVPDVTYALEQIATRAAPSRWPRPFEDPVAQAINYIFCDGQHKYAYNGALLEDFARQAGFSAITNVSREYGLAPRPYGDVMLGDEPVGSLVMDLRP